MNRVIPGKYQSIEPKAGGEGISVILCCHNSAARLHATLEALSKQDVPEDASMEIVVVDNASTDATARTARDIWQTLQPSIQMQIVTESTPGLIYARHAGIRRAAFEILLFCDDDNLLESDYIKRVYRQFSQRPALAALGGYGVPVFEKDPPAWFPTFASSYATGSQCITTESGRTLNLYGAGMAIRKSALTHLYSAGYRPLLTGRKGKALSGAEDTEMTYALAIAGYELDYDDQMRFKHVLTVSRLEFSYLEKLFLSSATDGPIRNLYHAYATRKTLSALMKHWPWHLVIALARIPKYAIKPPKPGFRSLCFRWSLRYLKSLFDYLPVYRDAKKNISRIPSFTGIRIASQGS